VVCSKHWFVVPNVIHFVVDINSLLEKSHRRISPRQQAVSDNAKRIIIDKDPSTVLLHLLRDEDAEQRCRSASCLFRLAQDGKFMHLYVSYFYHAYSSRSNSNGDFGY